MSAMDDAVCNECRAAVAALDRVLEERPNKVHDELVDAVRCLVLLRDDLIGRRRAGDDSPELRHQLDRTNAVLSVAVGGEYPLVGVRWDRVQKARDHLAQLLDVV